MIARAESSLHRDFPALAGPGARYSGLARELAQGVFLALLALLAAGPLLFGATRPWSQAVLLGIGGIAGFLVLAKVMAEGRRPVRVTALDAAVWLFVAYAAWQYAVAPSEIVARRELLLVVLYAIVFCAAWRHLPSSKHAKAVAVVIVALAAIEAAYGVIQRVRESPFIAFGVPRAPSYGMRAGGTFNCPNHFSGFLEIGLGLALGFVVFSKFSRWQKALLLAAAGAMSAGIFVSVSRGGWLATGAGLLVLAWLAGARRPGARWRIAVLALVFVAGAAAALALSPFARSRFEAMARGQDVRTVLYRDSIRIIQHAPARGTGPGTYQYMHPRVQDPGLETRARFAHCDYLNLACDYGLVGSGIVAFFLGALGWQLALVRRRLGRQNDEALWLGSVTALAMLLVHSLVDFNMHVPSNAIALLVTVVLPLGLLRRQESAIEIGPAGRWVAAALMAAGLCWYGVQTVRGGVASALCAVAQRSADAPNEEFLRLSRLAQAWDPRSDTAAELAGDYLRVKAAGVQENSERAKLGAEAIGYYTLARRNNPWEVTACVKQAMVCDLLRRYPEAFFLYQKALEQDPHNWRIRGWLARHFWERGMLDRAQSAYEQAFRLGNDPEIKQALEAVVKYKESKAR